VPAVRASGAVNGYAALPRWSERMNEELQSKLVEILASIQAATKTAGDFAMEQLPDIAQSYLLYGRVMATLSVLLWTGLFGVALYVGLRRGLFDKNGVHPDGHFKGHWQDSRVFCSILGCLGAIIAVIPLSFSASSAALVWLAPKVWLLKELAGLVR